MNNVEMFNELSRIYLDCEKSDFVVLGYCIENAVFYVEITPEDLLTFCGISVTSDETPVKRLRVKTLTKRLSLLFDSFSPAYLCDMQTLEETAKSDFCGNRGVAFESLVCAAYGGKLSPPNLPFWQGGDFTKSGISYSCKYQLATVITETTANEAICQKR